MFLRSDNKINITLCGMMGSGKSVIGKLLAKKINFNFVDIDKLIEKKAKKSINNIFAENGEKFFRKLEENITGNILVKKNYVISLGGGAIMHKSIRRSIKQYSYNIYLEVDINTLEKRLINSKNRPLINNKDINRTLVKLIKEREIYYKKADLIIKNETSIVNTIEKIIENITNND